MKPDPVSLLVGYVTYQGLRRFKKPLRKAAVSTTSQVINLISSSKEATYEVKEELEDIIAEAHYKSKVDRQQELADVSPPAEISEDPLAQKETDPDY